MKTLEAKNGIERSLIRYMKDIADSNPLSSDQETKLARRIQKGDLKARNKLVQANLRFVIRIALEYRGRGLSLGELVSSGNLGLLTAAERFDEKQGYRFISYAVWWVRQAMLQSLMGKRTVRLPVNRFDLLTRISKSVSGLQQKHDGDPGAAEIAEELGVTVNQVERTLLDSRSTLSLDEPFEEESGGSLFHTLADPAHETIVDDIDQRRMQEAISTALDALKDRESKILRLYFGLEGGKGWSLEQIGAHLGITRERVRQIKEIAIGKLRHAGRARRLRPYLETESGS